MFRPSGSFIVVLLFAWLMVGCIAPVEGGDAGAPQPPAAVTEASPMRGGLSTPERIDAALAAGEIEPGQRILYLAYAIYEPASLPAPYASAVPWRGTAVVAEIKEVVLSPGLCAFRPDVQAELRRLIQGAHQCN